MPRKKTETTVDESTLRFEDCPRPQAPDLSTDPGIRELISYIRSDQTGIWVYTHEEDRLINLVKRYVIGYRKNKEGNDLESLKPGRNLYLWSYTRGMIMINPERPDELPTGENANCIPDSILAEVGGEPTLAMIQFIIQEGRKDEREERPNIYIIQDLDRIMRSGNPVLPRKLRDMFYDLRESGGTHIIFCSTTMEIPAELEKYIGVVDLYPPDEAEIKYMLQSMIFSISNYMKSELAEQKGKFPDEDITLDRIFETVNIDITPYTKEEIHRIIRAAKGLTYTEILNTFNLSVSLERRISPDIVKAEKKQIIQKDKALEFHETLEKMSDVGGMDVLKEYLGQRSIGFTEAARLFGAREPRGILMFGIPGCGKSLVAKAVSNFWQLPLVKLDFGRVMQGLVGSSEENMRNALKTVGSIAPCVLWVDEIEKNAAGMGSSNQSDGGTFARVMSHFLTWMQERTKPVFVVATANSIVNRDGVDALPPELTRAGRFDDIFFVDLPAKADRREIMQIHLEKLQRDASRFDLDELAEIRYRDSSSSKEFDYSGAEIEQGLMDALFMCLAEPGKHIINGEGDITEEHVRKAMERKIPLSKSRTDIISAMRRWANTNAQFASSTTRRGKSSKIIAGRTASLLGSRKKRDKNETKSQ